MRTVGGRVVGARAWLSRYLRVISTISTQYLRCIYTPGLAGGLVAGQPGGVVVRGRGGGRQEPGAARGGGQLQGGIFLAAKAAQ